MVRDFSPEGSGVHPKKKSAMRTTAPRQILGLKAVQDDAIG
jgi:hypothetical protein